MDFYRRRKRVRKFFDEEEENEVSVNKVVHVATLLKEILAEAVTQRCYVKKVFLEILQNSQENTCYWVSATVNGSRWTEAWLLLNVSFISWE